MSNSEVEMELYKMLTETNQKHTYFLLAAVGACVGFAITQTRDSALSWCFTALAIALVCWGVSFVVGYHAVQQQIRMVNTNAALLKIRAGENVNSGSHQREIKESEGHAAELIEGYNSRAKTLKKCQFSFFILGVLFFIVWHILEMWRRTSEEYTCLLWY